MLRVLQKQVTEKRRISNKTSFSLAEKPSAAFPLSRRDIMRIARRLNAGKHPAWHTSPDGTAEGRGVRIEPQPSSSGGRVGAAERHLDVGAGDRAAASASDAQTEDLLSRGRPPSAGPLP